MKITTNTYMRTTKQLVIVLLLLCNPLNSFNINAQEAPDLNYLRTPEASAFKKYGEESVNEYTGTADISVPIYTIKCKDIEIPLVLRYDASGIKVEQEASWVGLGWNLMVGGCINYVCAGGHDMYSSSSVPTKIWTEYLTSEFSPWNGTTRNRNMYYAYTPDETSNWMNKYPYRPQDVVQSYTDQFTGSGGMKDYIDWGYGERDFYSVNVMGKSFMFFIDPATLKVFNIGKAGEEFIVTPNYSGAGADPGIGNQPDIDSWIITDSDRYKYYFSVGDKYQADNSTGIRYTTCWYLTEIESPLGGEVTFEYNEFIKKPRTNLCESNTITFPHGGCCNNVVPQNYTHYLQNENSNMNLTTHYLSKIETSNQTVNFLTSNSGECSGKKLDAIVIRTNDHESTQIEKIDFSFGSFGYSNVGSNYAPNDPSYNSENRLKLLNVREIASSDTITTSFMYNENVLLPSKRSCAQDYWGFYNGQENNVSGRGYSMIPAPGSFMSSNYIHGLSGQIGANRNSDGYYMQAAILNRIVYPTGGYTSYEYEPNTINNSTICGGLRIKKTSNYDNDDTLLNYTTYDYSNGVLLNNIETIDYTLFYNFANGSVPGTHSIEVFTITPGHPRMPAFYLSCNPGIVGYSGVTKCKYNADNTLEKKIVTSYINNAPTNTHGIDIYYYDLNNGAMSRQEVYDGNNNILYSIENRYDSELADHYATNIVTKNKSLNSGGGMGVTYTEYVNLIDENGSFTNIGSVSFSNGNSDGVCDVVRYPYILSRVNLKKTITTEYFSDGNTYVNTKDYVYSDINHQVSQIDESTSLQNKVRRTKLTYTADVANRSWNGTFRLNDVVETKVVSVENNAETCISTERTNYMDSGLPTESFMSIGNNTPESRTMYRYDGRSNIRSVTTDGNEIIYIWSYHGLYPIAKIEGISFDGLAASWGHIEDVLSSTEIEGMTDEEINLTKITLGQAEISKIIDHTNPDEILLDIEKIRQKVSELGGYATTYTFMPLIGMTSMTQPNGLTTTYEYDGFGRMVRAADHNGHTISTSSYNYKR